MIRLRRGIKRFSAFFCAALLLLHLTLFPIRARAAGVGALAAVAGVTVLGAYLMASGVYPYMTEAGQSLSEWTSDNLQPLLDKYNNYLTSIGKSYQITLQGATPTIKGYLTQGVVMIANDAWGKLREFVQWIQSEYALTDNRTGVILAQSMPTYIRVPYFASVPPVSQIVSLGLNIGKWSSLPQNADKGYYVGASASPTYLAIVRNYPYSNSRSDVAIVMLSFSSFHGYIYNEVSSSSVSSYNAAQRVFSESPVVYYWTQPVTHPSNFSGGLNVSLLEFDTPLEFAQAVRVGGGATITVDTTSVVPLEALPDDVPWGGLAVEGTGAAASPTVVENVIGSAIADRTKPVVRPVEVTVEAGTDVSTETGEITDDGIVTVTPADIPLVSTDYQIPGLSSVFPFSLPWDIYRVYSALNAEPVRPEWDVTIYVPILEIQVPMHIGFPEDVAPNVDDFMALARKLILVLLCVLTLVGVRNLIR